MKFLTNIDLDQNQLLNARIQNLGSDPAGGVEGQIYYNTTSDKLRIFAGGVWADVSTAYTHPTYAGDDIDVDTGTLTGATVVSRVDFNVTTDTLGHVTDANGAVTTRTLTLANLGHGSYTPLSLNLNEDQSASGLGVVDSIALNLTTDALGNVTGLTGSASGKILTDLNIAAAAIDDSHTGTSFAWSADRILSEISSSVAGQLVYKGGYDAALNSPDLETPTPGTILQGYTYTVTVAGTFFSAQVEPGDLLIAEIDDPAVEADWTIVNKNIPAVSDDTITITAGNALTGGGSFTLNGTTTGITLNHADTSTVANNTNSGAVVIQSLTFDTYGHVLTWGEVDLDPRFVNVTGDTMTGNLRLNDNIGLLFGTTTKSSIGYDTISSSTVWGISDGDINYIYQATTKINLGFATNDIATFNMDLTVNGDTIVNGTLSADFFSGNGGSIISLNASQLTSGSVPDARITATSVQQHVTKTYVDSLGINASALSGISAGSFLRSDVADDKTAGNLTFNDNIQIRLGTAGGESYLYSNATDTILDIQSGDYLIKYQAVNKWGIDGVTGNVTLYTGNMQLNSGSITLTSGGITLTTGTYTGNGSGLTNVNAATLGGQAPSYYLNYQNITNKPTYSKNIGNGTLNPYPVNHELGSSNINVTFYEGANQVIADVQIVDSNNINVVTSQTLTSDQLRIVVQALI